MPKPTTDPLPANQVKPEPTLEKRTRRCRLIPPDRCRVAIEEHPERFVGGRPRIKLPPQVVAINPLYRADGSIETETGVNFPTLTRAKEAVKLH